MADADDPWFQALEPVNVAVGGTCRAYQSLRALGPSVRPGSRALADLAEEPLLLPTLGRPVYDAQGTTSSLLDTVADHLETVRRAVTQDPPCIYAARNLGRSILELVGRARWLLDPSIDARRRAARFVTMQLGSLNESDRAGLTVASGRDPKTAIAQINTWAEQHDFTVGSDRLGPYIDEPMRTGMQCATLALSRLGPIAYQRYAAVGHGYLHGLFDPVEPEPELQGGRVTVHLHDAAEVPAVAFLAFYPAVRQWLEYHGEDTRHWLSWSERARQRLDPFVPRSSDT